MTYVERQEGLFTYPPVSRLCVIGVPVVAGAGPMTAWRGNRLVLQYMGRLTWAVVDGIGDGSPYIFKVGGVGEDELLEIQIERSLPNGTARGVTFEGVVWVSIESNSDLFLLTVEHATAESRPAFRLDRSNGGQVSVVGRIECNDDQGYHLVK